MLRKSIAGLSTMLTVAVLGVGFVAMPAAATTTGITVPDQFCTPAQTIVDQEAYDEVVVDQEAYDETVIVIEAQHYSLKGNSGIEKDETPAAPWGDDDYWQANTQQEPHSSDNVTWLNESHTGLHYTSHGSEGLRDWFYFQPEVSRTVHHDEVSHIEHHDAVTHEVPEVCDLWVTWATDTWAPDANDANDVAWPQHFVAFGQVSPTQCETTYQQDRYQGSRADINAVIGDGILAGLPPEDSGIVTQWAFVSTDTCGTEEPPCEAVDTPVWHVWTGGPIESDEGPAADAEGWNANSGMPQSANHLFSNHEAGVPYFVSHGNSGNGDWFLWTLEDCPGDPTLLPASVSWDGVDVCADPDGSGDLTVVGAHLVAATWDGEPYDGPLSDFHDGHYDATAEGHFVLTYEADDGYTFGDSSGVLDFMVDHKTGEECTTVYPVPTLFNAAPEPASCTAAGSFDVAALGGELISDEEGTQGYAFDHITLWVTVTGNQVHLEIDANDGFTLEGLNLDLWAVDEDGTHAERLITLDPQNTDPVVCPQDVDDEDPVEESNELDAPPAKAVEAEAQFAG